jgi:hypothetical protein
VHDAANAVAAVPIIPTVSVDELSLVTAGASTGGGGLGGLGGLSTDVASGTVIEAGAIVVNETRDAFDTATEVHKRLKAEEWLQRRS